MTTYKKKGWGQMDFGDLAGMTFTKVKRTECYDNGGVDLYEVEAR